MNHDEQYIIKHYGKRNNFRVPEDYFKSFPDILMQSVLKLSIDESLQKQQNPTNDLFGRDKIRPFLVAAASILLIAISTIVYYGLHDNSSSINTMKDNSVVIQSSDEITFDYFSDVAMIDNEDIYSLVSDN